MICEEIRSIRFVDDFADEKQGYIWHKSIWMLDREVIINEDLANM